MLKIFALPAEFFIFIFFLGGRGVPGPHHFFRFPAGGPHRIYRQKARQRKHWTSSFFSLSMAA